MTEQSPRQSEIAGLVRATQAGDRAAFDRLIRLYQRQAMRLATGMLGDVNDAAEVVQEALIKAYLGLKSLKATDRFQAWLLKIVANEAASRRRTQRRRAVFLGRATRQTERPTVRSPEEKGQAEDLKVAIGEAMAQLTAREAKAITLFGLDDLPHQEVARIMGCSTQATRWHVYRARQKLRHLLKEHFR